LSHHYLPPAFSPERDQRSFMPRPITGLGRRARPSHPVFLPPRPVGAARAPLMKPTPHPSGESNVGTGLAPVRARSWYALPYPITGRPHLARRATSEASCRDRSPVWVATSIQHNSPDDYQELQYCHFRIQYWYAGVINRVTGEEPIGSAIACVRENNSQWPQ